METDKLTMMQVTAFCLSEPVAKRLSARYCSYSTLSWNLGLWKTQELDTKHLIKQVSRLSLKVLCERKLPK